MRRPQCLITAVLCLAGLFSISSQSLPAEEAAVKIWEEPLVIPTYRIGESDRNPLFYGQRSYQGARGAIYPYPMLDKLTDVRENKTYKAVFLENQYVKLCVLPEIGGRILSAQDKTDGYDFFYHQHVIKPALIGMLGAWISGGVEWNIPHHHRATTYMTVDHTIEAHADGSKTVWVGELELRHRMKWLVGLTLYPDKSYIEATVKLFNRTPLVHSFLYFANVAVHANPDYQVIFPPSTEFATYHGKNEFLRWPISDRDFGGVDLGGQVDVSWWKNHPVPTSWFCFDCQEDFFAGYDHGKQAGVVHVADHHIVPGKKFWEFANGPEGRLWDKILTETDGPYIELMAGGYSDNQPDYSWIQPYEVKTLKQFWYPLRQLGGVKNANLNAAVNLEIRPDGSARIGLNTTSAYAGARVVLKAGGEVLFEQKLDISPEKPFTGEVALPAGVKAEDLTASLFSSANQELISYTPVKPKNSPLPEPVKPPPAPKDIKTVEELYLTGLRLEQFYNPAFQPEAYYEEALRRDPGDYRANTQLGVLYCRRGMFQEAEEKLQTAIGRATRDYTSPKDGEAFYYLGVAREAEGKYDAAYEAFYKATWSWAWHAAGYYQLAQLACRRGDKAPALEFVDRSLRANSLNTKALDLKAALLRRAGRSEEAARVAASALAIDPLDFWAGNEAYLADSAGGKKAEAARGLDSLENTMRGAAQSYLELAVDYGHCALWDEAIEVLSRLDDPENPHARIYPMVYYYLGYFSKVKGNNAAAAKYYRLASEMPPDYCFPFRWESVEVLRDAMRDNPKDARAPYYLGNLLYDHQPRKAIQAWEASRDLDGSFATVHRNLALAYAQVESNLPKAVATMEKAVACDPKDARLYFELDQLYRKGGVSPEKRLARLESNQETVLQRDDALQQEIILYVETGQYNKAIDLLAHHHFHTWEGGGDIHDVHISAHLLRGQRHFADKRYQEALEDFQAALEYPDNLEVAQPYRAARDAEIYYFIGAAYEAQGDAAQARAAYERAVAQKHEAPEMRYFQGLASRKLGRESQAAEIFDGLVKSGTEELSASSDMDYFAKFGERRSEAARRAQAHYLIGLGYLGQGKRAEARAEFQKVVENDADHLGARTQLAALH
jgi:tetratricopeptide (TPR) repeat protein